MATIYWQGNATAVAQVATATFGVYDATTTRTITIGGVAVSATDTGGTLTAALTAFAAVLNASTHPYFSTITWTSNATQIIGTADTAGVPFTFSGSVSGGTGTVTNAYTVSTASAGPNDWSTATNWSGGAVPVNSDVVIFRDNAVNVAWGLAQSAVSLTGLYIEKTYTGLIGLPIDGFATSLDGETQSTTVKPEYRSTYLAISASALNLGQFDGPGSASGSARIKIDLGSTASTVQIYDTSQTTQDTGLPSVRLKANSASTDVYVRSAPGGVGIACDVPGETSTVRKVSVSDTSTTSRVQVASGTTITTYEQNGGDNTLNAAATITTVTVNGGVLTTEGDYTITTGNVYGGTTYSNHIKTGGNAYTTLAINGGTIDALQSSVGRTWATVNVTKGSIKANGGVITITTLNDPSNQYTLTAS